MVRPLFAVLHACPALTHNIPDFIKSGMLHPLVAPPDSKVWKFFGEIFQSLEKLGVRLSKPWKEQGGELISRP